MTTRPKSTRRRREPKRTQRQADEVPGREALLAFIGAQDRPLTRSEIARTYGLKGDQRAALRRLLQTLEDEGMLERGQGRRIRRAGGLPPVTVIEVTHVDEDGEAVAVPANWSGENAPPTIVVRARRKGPAAETGQRLLARIRRGPGGSYTADPMRRVDRAPTRAERGDLIGVLRKDEHRMLFVPADRSMRGTFSVAKGDRAGALEGDLVVVEATAASRGRARPVKVTERVAQAGAANFFSRIAIRTAGIPDVFPDEVLGEAQAIKSHPRPGRHRADLRSLAFVTIDGADARDFDDAVFARPIPAGPAGDAMIRRVIKGAKGPGWYIAVAIADVSYYVRPGSALDREAVLRGNSVYFPDLVVPMLPERLSNDLCSLRPQVDRVCLVAHLHVGPRGQLKAHRFERAMIRSTARLTYSEVQAVRDGAGGQKKADWHGALPALYGAFAALHSARRRRGALDLDLPEYRPILADDGTVERIDMKPRLDSHRLIEELMIAANVAAAQTLERRTAPCMFRLHERPDPERVDDLAHLAAELNLRAGGSKGSAQWFNNLALAAREPAERHLISQLTLRAQAQAAYGPDNIGHFGLGLTSYAHFTSPIRRYADLAVHRSLVTVLGLGAGGLEREAADGFSGLGASLGLCERRAAVAERNTLDRFKAAFLEDSVGDTFSGLISGVTRFGLFVTIDKIGADGLIPMSRLGQERFRLASGGHALTGRQGQTYRIGQAVDIVLSQVDPVSGSALFDLAGAPAQRPGRRRGRAR